MNIKQMIATGILGGGASAAPVPWYLSGGVDPTKVLRVYEAHGAASKAAAKQNIISPGTLDLVEAGTVGWDAVDGFSGFSDANYFGGGSLSSNYSIVIQYANADAAGGLGYPRMFYIGDGEGTMIGPYNNDGNIYARSNGTIFYTTRAAAGIVIMTPTAGFLDGVLMPNHTPQGDPASGLNWRLGRGDVDGNSYPGSVAYVAIYNADIAAQAADITAALAALNP